MLIVYILKSFTLSKRVELLNEKMYNLSVSDYIHNFRNNNFSKTGGCLYEHKF